MKTTLDHLPEDKQKEIHEIVETIKQEANPEKVILFGSHATGEWVEDEYREDGIRYSYISDYDFLVVIKKNGQKEHELISRIENRCTQYKNAVSPIVHDMDYVNEGLAFGQYFFTDILKEGILLYDTENFSFVKPKKLTPEEEKKKAEDYYTIWFTQGSEFLIDAQNAFDRNSLRIGAFYLHQATENFYNTTLLVFTGYKPKTHNLQKLRNYAKHISQDLYMIFRTPITDEHEFYLFDLLKKGYINARYKLDYSITHAEFESLVEKVTQMEGIVKKICRERLAALG